MVDRFKMSNHFTYKKLEAKEQLQTQIEELREKFEHFETYFQEYSQVHYDSVLETIEFFEYLDYLQQKIESKKPESKEIPSLKIHRSQETDDIYEIIKLLIQLAIEIENNKSFN